MKATALAANPNTITNRHTVINWNHNIAKFCHLK